MVGGRVAKVELRVRAEEEAGGAVVFRKQDLAGVGAGLVLQPQLDRIGGAEGGHRWQGDLVVDAIEEGAEVGVRRQGPGLPEDGRAGPGAVAAGAARVR